MNNSESIPDCETVIETEAWHEDDMDSVLDKLKHKLVDVGWDKSPVEIRVEITEIDIPEEGDAVTTADNRFGRVTNIHSRHQIAIDFGDNEPEYYELSELEW